MPAGTRSSAAIRRAATAARSGSSTPDSWLSSERRVFEVFAQPFRTPGVLDAELADCSAGLMTAAAPIACPLGLRDAGDVKVGAEVAAAFALEMASPRPCPELLLVHDEYDCEWCEWCERLDAIEPYGPNPPPPPPSEWL